MNVLNDFILAYLTHNRDSGRDIDSIKLSIRLSSINKAQCPLKKCVWAKTQRWNPLASITCPKCIGYTSRKAVPLFFYRWLRKIPYLWCGGLLPFLTAPRQIRINRSQKDHFRINHKSLSPSLTRALCWGLRNTLFWRRTCLYSSKRPEASLVKDDWLWDWWLLEGLCVT